MALSNNFNEETLNYEEEISSVQKMLENTRFVFQDPNQSRFVVDILRKITNLHKAMKMLFEDVCASESDYSEVDNVIAPPVSLAPAVEDDSRGNVGQNGSAETPSFSEDDKREIEKIIREKRFERENFYRKTVMIRNLGFGPEENINPYKKCLKALKSYGLAFLLTDYYCEKEGTKLDFGGKIRQTFIFLQT